MSKIRGGLVKETHTFPIWENGGAGELLLTKMGNTGEGRIFERKMRSVSNIYICGTSKTP